MALHPVAAGRAWVYSHNIGRNAQVGLGFSLPVGVAAAKDGVLYVANRSGEQNPSSRISKVTVDHEFISEFGRQGPAYSTTATSHFTWLTGVALDQEENVYTTDEWKSQVSIFDKEGELLQVWGEKGTGEGQLDGPAGIALDAEENVWVVNANTSRVQKFTKDGQYLSGFGKKGDAEGELEMPYGITIDQEGSIYIVDWGNDRVQKFTPDGTHLLTFGHSGKGAGALDHPTGVCVDNEGDVYVVDWMHERVVIFSNEAKPLTYLTGDAVEVSPWGQMSLDANPDQANRRRQVEDLVDQQRKFRMPTGCTFDLANNRLIICDTQRGRLQVYNKDNAYMDPQFNL
ncbi:MAG: NHL repeat-containing protein [Dehalococcoidia bacterium]